MIFNLYYKLKKNLLLKKFKNKKKFNINKLNYIKNFNVLIKSKNSNNYIYNIIIYKYKNLKILYILSNKYSLLLIKIIHFWYILYYYNINYNNIFIIKNIFTYF
uniref:Open reading frame 105 n=1 Tax=Plasmodium ovale TaxID=36330 RepID=H7CDD5_PLAOA|nr:open reading frame 105 [Plasmodium ovale]